MTSTSSALIRRARVALCAVSLASAAMLIAPGNAAAFAKDGTGYVVLMPGGQSSIMHGTTDDLDRARTFRAGDSGLIYFRQKDGAYVVRDAEMLRRAQAIVAPQQALGARQGALGREQGALGRRQGELGREQARIAAMMADSTARRTGEVGRQQGELGRQQAELGAKQAELGTRQAELGRQQAAMAEKAEGQLNALFADALRRGLAKRVE